MSMSLWVGLIAFIATKALVFQPGTMTAVAGVSVDETTSALLWSAAAAAVAELVQRFPQIKDWLSKLQLGGSSAVDGLTADQDARLTSIESSVKRIEATVAPPK